MGFIISLIINAIAVLLSAYIVPGVMVDSFLTSVLVAVVLGLLNAVVKPVLVLLTLPVNILTLGLFSLVINVIILYLAAAVIPGFRIDGFWAALLFSIILSIVVGIFGILA